MSEITWKCGDDVAVGLAWNDDEPVSLRGIGADTEGPGIQLVELSVDDEGHVGTSPDAQHRHYAASSRLRYVEHRESGDELVIVQRDLASGLVVSTTFVGHKDVVRIHNDVRNDSEISHRLSYVSTLRLTGFGSDIGNLRIHVPYNAWSAEFRWRELVLEDVGIVDSGLDRHDSSRARFSVGARGSWSSGTYLPMGAVSDVARDRTWLWQVEHNGPWHWEVCDIRGGIEVGVSGPTAAEHQWTTLLGPGESFSTVPVALAVSARGFAGAIDEMTAYRRKIRRPHADNQNLPVIFNDYMNCLMGDPTTEKLIPLINAAAGVGCEYFVIDAGWYSDTDGWWDTVGEWRPSGRRFPAGLREVTDHIRSRGMVPGLWLEPEVVGVHSSAAEELPPGAYFSRAGHRLAENGRYHLDFSHPAVTARMDEVVDRLVAEFGVGYFKFDYNVSVPGTDRDADSVGDGLLRHNRAYSRWLDGLFDRHPGLAIENCSSGGMRVDYSQLSRMSIQSTSDQQDPLDYVPIAAAAPTALTPEQAAVWAYPQPEYTDEQNALCLVNALLGRIHLSGHINLMSDEQLRLVRSSIGVYKAIRGLIPVSTPSWPLGLPGWYDSWIALALHHRRQVLLAVWRRAGPAATTLALPALAAHEIEVSAIYPTDNVEHEWDRHDGNLRVTLPTAPSARLLQLKFD